MTNRAWLLFFLSPYLVGFVLFMGGPIIAGLALSFTEWNIVTPPVWRGVEQYRSLLANDAQFAVALRNTIYYILLVVPAEIAISFLLSLLLNSRFKGLTLFRAIYFMPFVLSLASVGLLWTWLYSGELGLLPFVLNKLGIAAPPFLADPRWAMPSVAFTTVWRNVGYYTVIFLAGLQSISPELYEAASLDGTDAWQRLRYVTLPLLSPTVFLILVVALIWGFQAFDLIYTMTRGGPANSTIVLAYYLYLMAFRRFNLGRGAAIAVILFAIIMCITLVQFAVQKRWVYYEREG